MDGITYTSVATPTAFEYLDTSVTNGSQYWYKVAAVSTSGTSTYTTPASQVPTVQGEMTLGQIRLQAQLRADMVNSNFIKIPEWNTYINQALFELYDLLVTSYEDYFVATPVTFNSDGTTYLFDLPNGVNYSAASPFYKLIGVDLKLNNATNAWVTLNHFNFINRNDFVYPNTSSTIYGVFNLTYRVLGSKVEFIPTPSNGQTMRLWYIPRMTMLLRDSDTTTAGINGWIEYVIVRAAKYALDKEESDSSKLDTEILFLKKRIEDTAPSRDAGQPDTISNIRRTSGDGDGWGNGRNGPIGGF